MDALPGRPKTSEEIEQGLEYGLTDDQARWEAATAYRIMAIADDWTCKPSYQNEESIEACAELTKEGFNMLILSRDNTRDPKRRWNYQCSVHIWGPDRLAIKPPDDYDWGAIQAGMRTCNECGAVDVDTERYSFAGRCCKRCRPAMAAQYEHSGWTS